MRPTGRTDIRIVIGDGLALFRSGLKRLLEDEVDLAVVGEACDGMETIESVRRCVPDILLLDIAIPRLSGIDVLGQLAELQPQLKTILLAEAIDEEQLRDALRLGARGVVLKSSPVELLIKSIRVVCSGQYWFDRATLADCSTARNGDNRSSSPALTPRELEIVSEIMAGSSNARIATKLQISEETVKRHLANIYAKLGLSTRLELALFALAHKLGRPSPLGLDRGIIARRSA